MATFQRSLVSLLLVLLGFGIIAFSLILIGCSFGINYDSDFRRGDYTETQVQSQFDYNQYWTGIPFLATGVLVILSAILQRPKTLIVITLIFCVVSMGLMLLVLSLSYGSTYNSMERSRRYWDSKGYSCNTNTNKLRKVEECICTKGKLVRTVAWIGMSCEQLIKLSGLYTTVVVSSIIVAVFCVFSVIIMSKFSWKQNRSIAVPTFVELSAVNPCVNP